MLVVDVGIDVCIVMLWQEYLVCGVVLYMDVLLFDYEKLVGIVYVSSNLLCIWIDNELVIVCEVSEQICVVFECICNQQVLVVSEVCLCEINELLEVEVSVCIKELMVIEEVLCYFQKIEVIGQLIGGFVYDFNNLFGGIIGSFDLMCVCLVQGCGDELFCYIDLVVCSV